MGKVIFEKDLNLLIKSEITKDYEELQFVINNVPDITIEDIKELYPSYYQFFQNIYPEVLKQAIDEWRGSPSYNAEERDKNEKVKCDICNHDLEYVCKIRNRFNGEEMNLGRDCNQHINIFDNKEFDKQIEKRKSTKRLQKLDIELPYIQRKLSEWNNVFDSEKVYVFNKYKGRYVDIREDIRNLFKEYIDSKGISSKREDEIIYKIKELLEESEIEREKIIKFIDENRVNYFMPTNDMISILRKSGDLKGLEWLEEDCVIKARTLHRIRDIGFATKLISKFNEVLKHMKISISKIDRYKNNIGYNIKSDRIKDVSLFYPYHELSTICGEYITGENSLKDVLLNLSYDMIIKESLLIDEYSIEYGLGLIETYLKSKNIIFKAYFHEYGDALWAVVNNRESEKAKYYYITKVNNNILDILKKLLFYNNRFDKEELFSIFENNSKNIGISDARGLAKGRNIDLDL